MGTLLIEQESCCGKFAVTAPGANKLSKGNTRLKTRQGRRSMGFLTASLNDPHTRYLSLRLPRGKQIHLIRTSEAFLHCRHGTGRVLAACLGWTLQLHP